MNRLSRFQEVLDELDRRVFSHASNLLTKLQGDLSTSQRGAIRSLAPKYLSVIENYQRPQGKFHEWLADHTALIDDYLSFLRSGPGRTFSHQSDLISSVVPEYICCIFLRLTETLGVPLDVRGQTDLIIELYFSPVGRGKLQPRFKRVDSAILVPVQLRFRGNIVSQFAIPVVAAEVKTNLDKNMIVGIANAASGLKSTFPLCKYFAISEFVDFHFETQSYANTDIDEVYILRKQKRGEFRRSGQANVVSLEVVGAFVDEVNEVLRLVGSEVPDVALRLPRGRLIEWRR